MVSVQPPRAPVGALRRKDVTKKLIVVAGIAALAGAYVMKRKKAAEAEAALWAEATGAPRPAPAKV